MAEVPRASKCQIVSATITTKDLGHVVLHNNVVAAAAASVPMCDFMVGVMDLNSDQAVEVQL